LRVSFVLSHAKRQLVAAYELVAGELACGVETEVCLLVSCGGCGGWVGIGGCTGDPQPRTLSRHCSCSCNWVLRAGMVGQVVALPRPERHTQRDLWGGSSNRQRSSSAPTCPACSKQHVACACANPAGVGGVNAGYCSRRPCGLPCTMHGCMESLAATSYLPAVIGITPRSRKGLCDQSSVSMFYVNVCSQAHSPPAAAARGRSNFQARPHL
jgi:hypothetical protein